MIIRNTEKCFSKCHGELDSGNSKRFFSRTTVFFRIHQLTQKLHLAALAFAHTGLHWYVSMLLTQILKLSRQCGFLLLSSFILGMLILTRLRGKTERDSTLQILSLLDKEDQAL